jgi:hypothetical protein
MVSNSIVLVDCSMYVWSEHMHCRRFGGMGTSVTRRHALECRLSDPFLSSQAQV